MTGARQDVVCKIFGENLDTLASYAKKIGSISAQLEGTRDIYVETVTGIPQIVVEYDRAALAQYGLNVLDVNTIVNASFGGQSSGRVYEGEKHFDLIVRLSEEYRMDIQNVSNLLIPTSKGAQIPLKEVAKVTISYGPGQIQREDAQRRIIIGFNVRGRDVQSIVKELNDKVAKQVKLPAGYRITYGGAFENLEQARKRLSVAVPVSLLLILLLLYFAFRSLKYGLLIYTAIPLSAIGGALALAIRDMPFSISAGVGFIALFGVSVLNGIVLVTEFNRLKGDGLSDLDNIILQGTKSRLRPVLMTALVASLGFLPMALSTGEGAEVQKPLATVVIGGLLVATLLTLFVLPILYRAFEGGIKGPVQSAAAVVFLAITLGMPTRSPAQVPITRQAAIDTALKNSLSLRNEKLTSKYVENISKTAWNVPLTNVSLDYGQINSVYFDNKLTIQQNIRLPLVYTRQKEVYLAQLKEAAFNVAIEENDIRKQVRHTYNELNFFYQKERLLLYADSLFNSFLQTAEIRFKKGESNTLEKITAETQYGQIALKLKQHRCEYEMMKQLFKLLLHTNSDFVPSENLKMPAPAIADSSAVKQSPVLDRNYQEQQMIRARWKLEKAKLLPDLFASYSNMTIRGVGADEKLYSGYKRFQSVQLGLGIPLFFGAQKASINAAKVQYYLSQNNSRILAQGFQFGYQKAVLSYMKNKATVQYYDEKGLQGSEAIIAAANAQLKSGEINYLQWVLLINNAISIQSDYLEALRELNNSIVELNYYLNK
jgi:heavy metal efflux system protein